MAVAQRKPNWFVIGVSSAVVLVLLGLGGFVVYLNAQATAPGEVPNSIAVDQETGAIQIGEGEGPVMQTYVDFICPHCNAFESEFGEQLTELANDGKITYEFIPVGVLDQQSQGTEFSSRAANAIYCVADVKSEAMMPYVEKLFENQPAQGSTGLTDEELVSLASEAGAGDIASCVEERTYDDLVQFTTKSMPENPSTGQKGTPTVTWDGEFLDLNLVEAKLAELE